MDSRVCNVLFLSTKDSARGMIAEAILNHWGRGKYHAFSAEAEPTQETDLPTLEFLQAINLPTAGLRNRSWSEFTTPESPAIDFVICFDDPSRALAQSQAGAATVARWRIADPQAVPAQDATGRKNALRRAFRELENRIKLFVLLRHNQVARENPEPEESRL